METVTRKQKLMMERCSICGQEITGHSEKQVKSRMGMHILRHRDEEETKKEGEPSQAKPLNSLNKANGDKKNV